MPRRCSFVLVRPLLGQIFYGRGAGDRAGSVRPATTSVASARCVAPAGPFPAPPRGSLRDLAEAWDRAVSGRRRR